MIFVLDASAVMAVMLGEPGAEVVREAERGTEISVVNVGEVFSKLIDSGAPFELVKREFEKMNLLVRTFRQADAWRVGQLRPLTREFGLSFGDRACIATAQMSGLAILTSDRFLAKAGSALGIDIRMIR